MKAGKIKEKRAFVYCRTSNDSEMEDRQKVSIEAQEESKRN